PFSQQLAFINKGTFDVEATEGLIEVVKAARETGKAASITITLKCQKLNGRDENTIKITPSIKLSIPELGMAETIMFSTNDGGLMRDDPSQVQMDLTVINTSPAVAPIKLQSQG
ncbi:MAG: hypothetical protein WAU54_20015, partial [Chania sp.]